MTWNIQEKQKIINDLLLIASENDLDMEYYETVAKRSVRSNDFFELFVDKLAEDLDQKIDKEVEDVLYSSPVSILERKESVVEKPNSEGEYKSEDIVKPVTIYHHSNKAAFFKNKVKAAQKLVKSENKNFNDWKNFTIRRRVGSNQFAYYLSEVDDTEGWEEYELNLSTSPVLEEFEGVVPEDVVVKAVTYEAENVLEQKGRICKPIDLNVLPDLKMGDSLTGMGIDSARAGDDNTIIAIRQGIHLIDIQRFSKADLMESCGFIVQSIREFKPDFVNIETVGGLGAGIYDRLLELGLDEVTVISGIETQSQITRHERLMAFNVRTEMYLLLQEIFRTGEITIPPNDSELFEELVCVTYKILSDGKIMLHEKKEIKKRLGRSPDRADAVALCYYSPVSINLY